MNRRHSSLLTLVVAAAAVSTAAVGTITAPAHAAQVAESTLSIRVPHPRIEAGDTTRVRGALHIRGPLDPSGRTVTLEAKPQGATDFTAIGTTVSGPHGGVGLEVAPTVTTRYRWHYAGAEDSRPSKSGIARVVIVADQHQGHKIHTSLSIRAAHRVVQPDGHALVRGRLRTHGIGLRNRVVDLLTRTTADPTWQVIGQDLSDRAGAVQFPLTPTGPAAYRLVFNGTAMFHRSHSGIVRIGVRPVVTATAAPAWINPGETATVSGVATLAGVPLSGASVDLVARPCWTRRAAARRRLGHDRGGRVGGDHRHPVAEHRLPARGPALDRCTARDQPRGPGEGAGAQLALHPGQARRRQDSW